MRTMLVALALAALTAAGCADTNDSAKPGDMPAMVVKITMLDNRYEPNDVTVPKGRDVTFRFTNSGTAVHEALVGDAAAQQAHVQEMMGSSDMGGMHHSGASDAVTVAPDASADITRRFDTPGDTLIGCHQAGHWEDGMKVTVTVT